MALVRHSRHREELLCYTTRFHSRCYMPAHRPQPKFIHCPPNSVARTIVTWQAAVNCSGSTFIFVKNSSAILSASDSNSMTYFTVGDTHGQMDNATQGFLPIVVCPSPNVTSFNPYKFGMALFISLGFLRVISLQMFLWLACTSTTSYQQLF